MKKLNLLFFIASAFSAHSFAQSVSATATATATIVTPLAINKTVDLNFGNLAVNGTAGTLVLAPATAARTVTGGVSTSAGNPGTVTAASFAVTGSNSYTYAITLPATATTLTNGGNTMTATAFTSFPTVATGGTLSAAGAQTLLVGATLNVGANQATGVYLSGTPFTVSVVYN